MQNTQIETLNNSIVLNNTNITDFATSFINYLDVKEASLKTYIKGINAFINFANEKKLAYVRQTIKDFKTYLITTNHSANTIHSYLNSIKKFYDYLSEQYNINNEYTAIKSPTIENDFKKDYLTEAQAKELLSSIDTSTPNGKRNYIIIAIMLTSGTRTIELTRANIEDIQLKNGKYVLYLQRKGRDTKQEYIYITDPIEKMLRQYLATRHLTPTAPLFTSDSNNSKDQRLTRDSIGRIVKTQLRTIGLDSPRLTAHSLRHTTATLNLLNGATLEETQQLLGHKSINTTMIYNHALTREKNQSEERLANILLS